MVKDYVKAEVLKRLENRDSQFLDLEMKNGDIISIENTQGSKGTTVYWVYFSKIAQTRTTSDLDELADWLMNHPKKQNEIAKEEQEYCEDNIPKLAKYYEEHIKGHTLEELSLGNHICMEIYDYWRELPAEAKEGISYIFDTKLDKLYLEMYMKKHPEHKDYNKLLGAYNLANHFSSYSDWYKDVYGYRPRDIF